MGGEKDMATGRQREIRDRVFDATFADMASVQRAFESLEMAERFCLQARADKLGLRNVHAERVARQ